MKIYYKKIYFSNEHKLPFGKPIIYAVNHPTAFNEPVIINTLIKKGCYFMVRGDFFKKPLFRSMLEAIHLIPIFRMQDGGVEGLKKNDNTFDITSSYLSSGKDIMILAEGLSKHEKRMRPILKGCGRMALKAINEDPSLDIHIVPIGVNYEDAEFERTDVMIQINDAIRVQDYLEKYENKNKAVVEITKEISKRMREKIIHIDDSEDDDSVEILLKVVRSNFPLDLYPPVSRSNKRFFAEFNTVEKINGLDSDQKTNLFTKANNYKNELNKYNISDRQIYDNRNNKITNWIAIIIGAIPAIFGFLFNFIPVYIGKNFAKKKIKRTEFKSPVVFGFSMFIFIFIYGVLILFSLFTLNLGFFLFVILHIFLGHFYVIYKDYFEQFTLRKNFKKVKSNEITRLISNRNEIVNLLD